MNSQGPYVVTWTVFDQCRGPKAVNFSEIIPSLKILPNGDYMGVVNTTFLDNVKVDEVRAILKNQNLFC